MINKYMLLTGLLILLVLPLVYAGNYSAGAYNADTYSVVEVPATTTPPSGGGSSGGSSSSITTPITIETKEITAVNVIEIPTEVRMEEEATMTFIYKTELHKAYLVNLQSDQITLRIESTPKIVTIGKGETEKVDLNNDGTLDIKVYFKDIISGRARLEFTALGNWDSECSLDSDCNKTQYCFENKCYDAECYDDSACDAETGETCWHGRCVKLFDVEIKDFESPIKLGEFFEFTYLIKGMADINDDVEIHFWIEKDEEVITSGHDTIYIGNFEEKTKTTKLFLPSDITSGDYVFSVQLIYETYQAKSHRTIEITVDGGLAMIGLSPKIGRYTNYMISALIGIGAFILFFIFYLERRKMKKAIMPELRWIKKYRITILTSLLFAVLGALIYYLRWYELIADWGLNVASWGKINILSFLGGIVLLIALVIGLIVAKKKKLFERFRAGKEARIRKDKSRRLSEKSSYIKDKINFYKLKRKKALLFLEKHKILLSVILLLIILAGIISYLFYTEVLTVGQLKNFRDSVVNGLITGYNATVDLIVKYWLYLTIGAGIVILGFILYLVRKQLRQAGNWIAKMVGEHKVGFAVGLGIVILIGIIVYLFYSGILILNVH